jgi:hypothetical protein
MAVSPRHPRSSSLIYAHPGGPAHAGILPDGRVRLRVGQKVGCRAGSCDQSNCLTIKARKDIAAKATAFEGDQAIGIKCDNRLYYLIILIDML